MLLEEFNYELPRELIAQRPLKERDASRMMLLDRSAQGFTDHIFRELPELLKPGDLLVVNNTRVFPARLLGRRRGTTAQPIGRNNPTAREYLTAEVELLLTRNESGDEWQGLVHPGRKIRTGEVLEFGGGELEAEVLGRGDYGMRRVLLRAREGSVASAIDRLGHVPLPPYVSRPDEATDRETYQTVYARVRGAVAAPTAGFHFTQRVFDSLKERQIEVAEITLHVGPGTFRPVQTERVEEHRMDSEEFEISAATAAAINSAFADHRRVIAVGTTSVRTLESVALQNAGRIVAARGDTDLFITPGFRFQIVGGLLTNFHLPKSTLVMLVSAFASRELIFRAYQHAIEQSYRFYSYGDCMLIL